MLSTVTLGKAYDHLTPIQRLWMQSRVRPDEGKGKGKGKSDGHGFWPPLWERPYTFANVLIAMDLAVLMVPRAVRLLCSREHAEVRVLVARYVVVLCFNAVLPALQLSASGRLLDLAETSLASGQAATWRAAVSAGAVVVLLALLSQAVKRTFKGTEARLAEYVKYKTEKEYLRLQLQVPLPPSTDPVFAALLVEAAVHGGARGSRSTRGYSGTYSSMSGKIRQLGGVVSVFISIVSQLVVTVYALKSGGLGGSTATLLVLFALPVLGDILARQKPLDCEDYGDDLNRVIYRMTESVNNREEVAVSGLQEYILKRWDEATLAKMKKCEYRDHEAGSQGMTSMLHNLVWVLLATRVVETSSSLATLALLQGSIMGLSHQSEQAMNALRRMTGHTLFLAAFVGLMETENQHRRGTISYETIRDPAAAGMKIQISDLSVTYKQKAKPAVHGINLTIEAGETLALVGYNGSGKTTLVKALLGLVESRGSLRINGHDISSLDMSTAYPRISVIFQDFHKYGLTLKEEIAAGDIASLGDMNAINRAIDRGGTRQVVDKIPLDTIIASFDKEMAATLRINEKGEESDVEGDGDSDDAGDTDTDTDKDKKEKTKSSDRTKPWFERTTYISGGEWQRVALARAFMGADKADLIVFDEPTAALDPKAESELFDTLMSLSHRQDHRCTTIFISHQFGNVRRADKIAFMADGTIQEYGTHDELMARKGKYSELFSLQAKGFGVE